MAHELESMMYVDAVPWHGLGTKLDEPPTVQDAIRLAGLDWEVETRQLYYKKTSGYGESKSKSVVRKTDERELGVVGPEWTPFQNMEAFNFFQPFVSSGEVTLETAGSLRGGRHVWILSKIKRDPIDIVKDDPVLQYLLLANGHDGTLSASVAFTPIRVVCANTLSIGLEHRNSKVLRAYHNKNIQQAMDLIQETVDATNRTFTATAEMYKELARHQISEKELKAFVVKVFVDKKKQQELNKELEKVGLRTYNKIVPLFEEGHGNDLPEVKGTWWAAYNAVTEYLNHQRGRNKDTRVDSLWFGQNNSTNNKALRTALDMALA